MLMNHILRACLKSINIHIFFRRFGNGTEIKTLLNNSSSGHLIKNSPDLQKEPFESVLQNAKLIGYYFSAAWCTHCFMLLPIIKKMYKDNLQNNRGLVIIYISIDEDEKVCYEYFQEKHGEWYCIPFGDTLVKFLIGRYFIKDIPQVIIVDPQGNTVSIRGRFDIEENRENAVAKWLNQLKE